MKRAHELDPLSLAITRNLGIIFYFAGQYDEALEVLKKTIEMDPNFGYAHFFLGLIYTEKSMYKEALVELQKERMVSKAFNPLVESNLGILYVHMGKRGEATKILDELIRRSEQSYVSPFHIARLYFALGEDEHGLEWLDKAYKERDIWLRFIKVFRTFDKVRSHARFTGLLKKIGLEK